MKTKTNAAAIITTAAATSAGICLAILIYHHGKRRGRIEAQAYNDTSTIRDGSTAVSTRSETSSCMIKPIDHSSTASKKAKKSDSSDEIEMLPVYPIGTLRSIYRLCVGTPRQVSYLCI